MCVADLKKSLNCITKRSKINIPAGVKTAYPALRRPLQWTTTYICITDECEDAYWLGGEVYVDMIAGLSSALECLARCAKREDFVCRSIAYYTFKGTHRWQVEMRCLLYTENKFTSPYMYVGKSGAQYCTIGKIIKEY